MQEHHDQFTLSLLRNDPEKFLLLCQPIIQICVRQYIASGMFHFAEEKDIIQSINEKLYSSLPSVAENYSGRVLLKTYINIVIKNICLKINEQHNRTIKTIQIHEEQQHYVHDPTVAVVVEEEIRRLHTVLQLFHSNQNKLYVCMKLFFKIPLTEQDILRWSPSIRPNRYSLLLSKCSGNYNDLTLHQVFEKLAPVLHDIERNRTTAGTILRWTNRHIYTVIKLMNGDPPRRSHTRETLQFLLGEEYSRSLNKD